MSWVRFYAADGVTLLFEEQGTSGDSLLEMARRLDAPLHWRCGQGTCGTCLVRLRHAGQPGRFTPSARERNVLTRFGHAASADIPWPDTAQTWRLACHVVLGEHPLDVLLPPA